MSKKVKTIYLLRHGKSSWDYEELDDMKRVLLPKGEKRTQRIANYLKENHIKIDKIITSPAIRAKDTAKIVEQSLNLPEAIIDNNLYPGSPDDIYNAIIEQNDNIDNILIVGHNPGLTYFAHEHMHSDIDNLPTSGLISCRYFSNSWTEFSLADKKLNFVVFPKNL